MTSRRPLVAANWKMGGSRQLAEDLMPKFRQLPDNAVDVVLCPPSVYLDHVGQLLGSSTGIPAGAVRLGGQNLNEYEGGAYTGEVSGPMLRDCGCDFVIIGHSERRRLFGETPDLVATKFEAALKHQLTPIVCVGESLQDREQGRAFQVVGDELDAVINAVGIDALGKGVIAYEPVWAIGTGKVATPEQAQEMHVFIRQKLTELSDIVGQGIRILYGGSVKADNAAQLFGQADIDGGLIGGASLNADEFIALCQMAARTE